MSPELLDDSEASREEREIGIQYLQDLRRSSDRRLSALASDVLSKIDAQSEELARIKYATQYLSHFFLQMAIRLAYIRGVRHLQTVHGTRCTV